MPSLPSIVLAARRRDALRVYRHRLAGGLRVDGDYRESGLAGDLARSHLAVARMTGVLWLVGFCGEHLVNGWTSVGYACDRAFGMIPYPDARYRSCIVCCDLQSLPEPLQSWVDGFDRGNDLHGPGSPLRVAEVDSNACGTRRVRGLPTYRGPRFSAPAETEV